MGYVALIIIILILIPIILIFRGVSKASGWVYETLRIFFNESLEGKPFRETLSRVFAMLGAILIGIIVILVISLIC